MCAHMSSPLSLHTFVLAGLCSTEGSGAGSIKDCEVQFQEVRTYTQCAHVRRYIRIPTYVCTYVHTYICMYSISKVPEQ